MEFVAAEKEAFDKWRAGRAEAGANLDELRATIATETGLSTHALGRVIQCGLYAGARDAAGRRHGVGRALLTNGDAYDGEFAEGVRHGHGRYTFTDGSVYEGQYVRGKREGRGMLTASSGLVYDGAWRDNQFDGEGRLTLPNGDVYEGGFRAGAFHGHGTMRIAATGESFSGSWEHGVRAGNQRWELTKSLAYVGTFDADRPVGAGMFVCGAGAPSSATVSGRYSDESVAQGEPVVFAKVKAGEDDGDEAAAAAKKAAAKKAAAARGAANRGPPRLATERRFVGDAWAGVCVK